MCSMTYVLPSSMAWTETADNSLSLPQNKRHKVQAVRAWKHCREDARASTWMGTVVCDLCPARPAGLVLTRIFTGDQ